MEVGVASFLCFIRVYGLHPQPCQVFPTQLDLSESILPDTPQVGLLGDFIAPQVANVF